MKIDKGGVGDDEVVVAGDVEMVLDGHVITALQNAATQLSQLRAAMIDRTEKFERVLKRLGIMAAIQTAIGIILVIVAIGISGVTNKIDDVTNPNGPYAQRAAVRTVGILEQLSVENDCRHRRAEAGLPAPDPARPFTCPAQTDKSVYPGE